MDSIRVWITGMLCVAAVLTLATLNVIPGYDFPRHGYITGHVTLDGRPVTSGMVFLVSKDRDHQVLAKGLIDSHGDYSAYSTWQHRWERGAHFTLWVVPHSLLGTDVRGAYKVERDPLNGPRSRVTAQSRGLTISGSSADAVQLKASELLVDLDPSTHHIDVNLSSEHRLASASSVR